MTRSYVVTGAARGVGLAIARALLAQDHAVVSLDLADSAVGEPVIGSAADGAVAERAAVRAGELGTFSGWVNNAAVFRDADLHEAAPGEVMELISANIAPAVVGSAAAVRHLLAAGRPGSIVNVSSHQAQRAVRGALAYATAKAGIEGLTRALAVDYGPRGIRTNAVALGSVRTERYDELLASQSAEQAAVVEAEIARLHPLGRVGAGAEVASVVAFLLSDAAAFVNGAVLPVDGGRAAQGLDPEQRD